MSKIQVTPENLIATAPAFHSASQETQNMSVALANVSVTFEADIFLLMALIRYAQALSDFITRWEQSMTCLAEAEEDIGARLELAAEGYNLNEQVTVNGFKTTQEQLIQQWRNIFTTPTGVLPPTTPLWPPQGIPIIPTPGGQPIIPQPGGQPIIPPIIPQPGGPVIGEQPIIPGLTEPGIIP